MLFDIVEGGGMKELVKMVVAGAKTDFKNVCIAFGSIAFPWVSSLNT